MQIQSNSILCHAQNRNIVLLVTQGTGQPLACFMDKQSIPLGDSLFRFPLKLNEAQCSHYKLCRLNSAWEKSASSPWARGWPRAWWARHWKWQVNHWVNQWGSMSAMGQDWGEEKKKEDVPKDGEIYRFCFVLLLYYCCSIICAQSETKLFVNGKKWVS